MPVIGVGAFSLVFYDGVLFGSLLLEEDVPCLVSKENIPVLMCRLGLVDGLGVPSFGYSCAAFLSGL